MSAGVARARLVRCASQSEIELVWLSEVELALGILWILSPRWSRLLRWSVEWTRSGFGFGRSWGSSEFPPGGVGEFVSDAGDSGVSGSGSGSGSGRDGVPGQGEQRELLR